jgi:hypothetical protein
LTPCLWDGQPNQLIKVRLVEVSAAEQGGEEYTVSNNCCVGIAEKAVSADSGKDAGLSLQSNLNQQLVECIDESSTKAYH